MFFCLFEHLMSLNPGWFGVGISNPGSPSLCLLLRFKWEILNYFKALKEIQVPLDSQGSTYTLTWFRLFGTSKMQEGAFFFLMNQSLILDNLEFGSTCCIILALPPTPLWPWKFLILCTHLPILTVDLIFALQVVGCCWVGELNPSKNANRNQGMEELALRKVEFPSFSSPKIPHFAAVCVPRAHQPSSWFPLESISWRNSFQGVIPAPECCCPAPKTPLPSVESSAPVLPWWHWDTPTTPGTGNWGISIPSTAEVFGMSCVCMGSNPSSQSMRHSISCSLCRALKSTLCLHHIDLKAEFLVALSSFFGVYQERFVLFSDKPHFKKRLFGWAV